MSNVFCTNCGASINPGAKFCNKCGTPIAVIPGTTVTPRPVPTQQPQREFAYRYIMPASYKKGLVSQKGCTLIFSDDSIITAMVDNKMMNQHVAEVKESVKGEKLLKRTAAMMKSGNTFCDRYWKMTPDQILSEHQNNFSVRNNTVEKIKFTRSTVGYSYDDTTTNIPPSLLVKCPGGKFNYIMKSGFDSKTFVSVLRSLFPSQYKGPKK